MNISPGMIRYTVIATMQSPGVIDEYIGWLKGGHIQTIIDEGGALQGDVSVLEGTDNVQVASTYIFPDKKTYDAYCSGLALRLRPEGVALFVDTNKVKFSRMVSEVNFSYCSTPEYAITEATPYLYFNGNCREAMEFYKECLGGALDIMVYAGSPTAAELPPGDHNNVMHSSLVLSDKARLMASDSCGTNKEVSFGDNVAVSVNFTNDAEITTAFEKLSAGGTVTIPLADQFWGGKFAQFVDKFGVLWMLHLSLDGECMKSVIEITSYLRFNGACREATSLYNTVLGGHLDIMTFEGTEMGAALPKEDQKQIMHSLLQWNNKKCSFMASDSGPGSVISFGDNASVSLLFTKDDKAREVFDRLSEGGVVLEPLKKQFWGGLFGHVKDRFGLCWMVVGPHECGNSETEDPEAKKAKYN